MKNKLYWGLGILIVLLIGAFVFVMNKNQIAKDQSETRQLETDLADVQKKSEAHNEAANTPKEEDISDDKPPPAEQGFKWVRHGDHWNKIPIQDTNNNQEVSVEYKAYKGPLTYHEELLKTNPAEALRKLSIEMNHWSAEHIPDIPPDDKLATEYAKIEYLMAYIRATGEVPSGVDPKELDKKFEELHKEHRRLWYSTDGIINWQDPNNPTNRFVKLGWIGLEPPLRWDEDGDPLWW